jgi:ferredoxin
MSGLKLKVGDQFTVARSDFPQLLELLRHKGYTPVGPTLKDGDLVYDELASVADLPAGWTDDQGPGAFRLRRRDDAALFGYGVGQQSWKRFLFPPRHLLWQARREGGGFKLMAPAQEVTRFAFIGAHACDLSALEVLDKVFLNGPYADPAYQGRRSQALVVAVNCTQACGTGFCASLGTGPRATRGFDLALTEILSAGQHYFLVEVGTEAGAALLAEIPHQAAGPGPQKLAADLVTEAASRMGRVLDPRDLKEVLYRNYEHPRWDDVAGRCLNCANCTLVCPTCFCHTLEDSTDLTGELAERRRRLDSCFNVDFSYIHGGSIRATPKSRYRQWLTHKLGTWMDQFGCLGCVGCGRCLTWCPVAIDITEEVKAIRESEA